MKNDNLKNQYRVNEQIRANEVRIAYVLDKAQLKRAIFVLGKALEQYPYRTNK